MLCVKPEQVERLAKKAMASKRPFLDVETNGLRRFLGHRICGMSVYIPESDEAYYIPIRHAQGRNATTLEPFRQVFEQPGKVICNHGIKFDVHMWKAEGFDFKAAPVCTLIGTHLLDENVYSSRKLEELCDNVAGGGNYRATEAAMLEKCGKKDHLWKLDPRDCAEYAENDVRGAHAILNFIQPKLKEQGLLGIWQESSDYIMATVDMEENGMLVDQDEVHSQLEALPTKMAACALRIEELSGGRILNGNSSPQVQRYFNVKSCDKDFLNDQADPVAEAILDYRFLTRLKANYYEAIQNNLDDDGYIHPNLNITGTVAGRPSCSEPNLLAIPKDDSKWGVKKVFIAPDGWEFAEYDWNQIELRLLAHYTKEPELLKAFIEGLDLHQMTADALGVDRDVVAKRTNFSSVYRIGAKALAPKIKRTVPEAKAILTAWDARYPNVDRLHKKCEAITRQNKGYIKMWTGRRKRYVWESEYRKAMSGLIQGGVAEMMRLLVSKRLRPLLDPSECKMQIQVYDAVLFRWRREVREKYLGILEEAFCSDWPFSVPIKCDIKVGNSWGLAIKIK